MSVPFLSDQIKFSYFIYIVDGVEVHLAET